MLLPVSSIGRCVSYFLGLRAQKMCCMNEVAHNMLCNCNNISDVHYRLYQCGLSRRVRVFLVDCKNELSRQVLFILYISACELCCSSACVCMHSGIIRWVCGVLQTAIVHLSVIWCTNVQLSVKFVRYGHSREMLTIASLISTVSFTVRELIPGSRPIFQSQNPGILMTEFQDFRDYDLW